MVENTEQYLSDSGDVTGEFFSVGAPLHAVRAGYIRRSADETLYRALAAGAYAHVIAPDRTGKSSLIAATAARLQNNGVRVAVLDLRQISDRDGGADAGRWYYSVAYRLLRQLRLKVDLQSWWQDKSILSNRQRLVEFYIEVVLQNIDEPVVIFVDEVQCVAVLPFTEHLLASIRAAHNARGAEPEFTRLTFALVGECDPRSLVDDAAVSPFSVSKEILLGDFSRADLDIFATEMNLSAPDAATALDRIFAWTGGHPYLTQKLARSVARECVSGDVTGHVDRIAMQQLAGRAALHSEPHIGHIHRAVTGDSRDSEGLLNLYGKLRKGVEVPCDPASRLQRKLMAVGLIVRDDNGELRVRNRIYQTVFTARWANDNLPLHWRGPAIAAGIVLLITAIPFWYTQVLPRGYTERMFDPMAPLEMIHDSYQSLSSFPGHADSADRLYRMALHNRSSLAGNLSAVREIDAYVRSLPQSDTFADGLLAAYWDRRVRAALREEQREMALIASLEALIESTPSRRRRAATLIGDDYPQLVGTIPPQAAAHVTFSPDDMLVSFVDGPQVRQWSLAGGVLQPRPPWTIQSLEITPLVRRVMIDREGAVSRVGLTVNVSHSRLADLRLKLIAPSGRTADLLFRQLSSSANETIRFGREDLGALIGEPLNGTWSLSLRDEGTGVDGHLMGWNLSLNSQVVVENFDRGLDIPDPEERVSNDVWLSPDGQFAIARSSQSDGMRQWDLADVQAARTAPVPASESIIGVSSATASLVTAAADRVNLWSTSDGRRHSSLAVGSSAQQAQLSADGRRLLVQSRADADTSFQLWSLETGKMLSSIAVAGTPALVTVDASGRHLAVADYDRSVRIWDFQDGELRAQFNLSTQPSEILLSPDGSRLGVVHATQGVSLWRTDAPGEPLLQEWQSARWQVAFSRSGQKFLAGNPRYGFQVFRSDDGVVTGPLLGSGLPRDASALLAFSADEKYVLTASQDGMSRLWHVPVVAPGASVVMAEGETSGHRLWRASGYSVSAIAPGGRRLAVGDNEGHVHIAPLDSGATEMPGADEELSFIGHQGPVDALAFSPDGSLVASAARDGTVRVWDTSSGLPRQYYASASVSTVEQMRFSRSGVRLALFSGRRLWILNVDSGAVLTEMELGEGLAAMAFIDDDRLYIGSDGGTLRSLSADRSGSWNLRNVWQGTAPLRRMEVSPVKQFLILVDARQEVRLLDIRNGRIGESVLTMPGPVSDILFGGGETHVMLRTARWIHRAAVSTGGVVWIDAIRAPKPVPGSRMVLDTGPRPADRGAGEEAGGGDHILVLTRQSGFAEVAELRFNYTRGPTLVGNRDELLREWRARLALPPEDAAVAAVSPNMASPSVPKQ